MYLKRLYVHGFKSFAGVSKLDFEPGISAIVGPNGSGKSNIADAIRWALGEQSTRNLRLKKSDEVIFAGTEKRAKASLAEVRLLFDNSAGKLSIDASEIEISRLMFRSGETEYRLNGKKAPLREIQQILGEAGFGANSYSVIGQGTIDSFILATPSERKLLFDEASGIRVHELGREAAIKKLQATDDNMSRIRDILAELAPSLSVLAKAAQAAELHSQHQADLQLTRRKYYGGALQELHRVDSQLESECAMLTSQLAVKQQLLAEQETARKQVAQAERNQLASQKIATQKLLELEIKRDSLANDLSVKRAELQFMLEEQGSVGQDEQNAANVHSRRERLLEEERQLASNLASAKRAETQATSELEAVTAKIRAAQTELNTLRHDNLESSQREFVQHALGILKQVALDLRAQDELPRVTEQLRLMIHKAGRLLSLATTKDHADILASMRKVQAGLSTLMTERETTHDHYTEVVIGVRSLELDIQANAKQAMQAEHETNELSAKNANRKTQLNATITARKQHLAKLEIEADNLQVELDELRTAQRNQPASGATGIFEMARNLEEAAAEVRTLQQKLLVCRERSKTQISARHELQTVIGQLGLDAKQLIETTEDLALLERRMIALAAKLEDSALVEGDSEAKYREATERFDFLSGQLADLDKASASLREAITSFERLIKLRFEEAFKEISEHFGRYFAMLFGGGRARLEIRSGEENVYGIEIIAVPPGKRVESLAVLSGGERSLVGIALLAAILAVNPSPFVVLDEVDAALDEANSSRFSRILESIGQSAQFLVITHNRQTMRAAHSLFGVSMDDQHVSSLLSMRLEAAEKLAE